MQFPRRFQTVLLGKRSPAHASKVVLRKIALISLQECADIGRHNVDLTANLLCFLWLQATKTKIGVQTANHALEQFLVGFPGRGEDQFVIPR